LIFPGKIEGFLTCRSIVSLWRKQDFFQKRSKRRRGFHPDGMSKHTFVHQEIELEALKSLLGSKWRSPRLGYARESETRGGW